VHRISDCHAESELADKAPKFFFVLMPDHPLSLARTQTETRRFLRVRHHWDAWASTV